MTITHEDPGSPDDSRDPAGTANGHWRDRIFSATYACPEHPEASLPELSPRMFSFNSPYGACESCDGLGTILEFDPELIVPDASLSLSQGAVDAWRHGGKRMNIFYNRLSATVLPGVQGLADHAVLRDSRSPCARPCWRATNPAAGRA